MNLHEETLKKLEENLKNLFTTKNIEKERLEKKYYQLKLHNSLLKLKIQTPKNKYEYQ